MKRNPYADLGLVVAIAAFIITLIRCFLFGLSWASIACLAFTVVYLLLSALKRSDTSIVRRATTAYLLLMFLTLVCVVLFDKNATPKMHAFEGAAVDTVQEEEFVVAEKDIPVEIIRPDTLQADTLSGETPSEEQSESAEPSAEPESAEPAESSEAAEPTDIH